MFGLAQGLTLCCAQAFVALNQRNKPLLQFQRRNGATQLTQNFEIDIFLRNLRGSTLKSFLQELKPKLNKLNSELPPEFRLPSVRIIHN